MLRTDVTLSPLRVALQLRHTCRITPLLASSAQFHIHVGDRDRETALARVNGDPADRSCRGTSTPKLRRHNKDVHLTVLDGLPADHESAVRVWRAANVATFLPPSVDRVARIWEKLAEPEAVPGQRPPRRGQGRGGDGPG